MAAGDQRVLRRELLAELSLLEKDRQIEALEARIRELEGASHREALPETESSQLDGAAYATAADIDALCRKSGGLVGLLAALSLGNEAKVETRQCTRSVPRGSRVAKDSRRSLLKMEALVQQRLQRIERRTSRSLISGPFRPTP